MLTKFYKFYLHIHKDIKHLVRKNYKLHNNVFLIVKFNKYDCKTPKTNKKVYQLLFNTYILNVN
jgi:hypothetical protein